MLENKDVGVKSQSNYKKWDFIYSEKYTIHYNMLPFLYPEK